MYVLMKSKTLSIKCQLYPCQPISHYTSFIKKEHDQILRQRNSSTKISTKSSTINSHIT